MTVARHPPAIHRTTWRGTGTRRCPLGMAWSMPRKSARSWMPRRSVGDVANVSCVRDQARSPTASRRRREARRCSPPYSTNESMEFSGRIVWDLVRSKLAAPRHHLMGGKPDTQIHELDTSAAVCPPYEAQLLDE